jgi:hypothetical protein
MRIIPCVLIWMAATAWAIADPAPERIAVVSDADTKDLAALVTTELSSNSDISLLERDDLAKVGDELKLQQLADSDAVALGKLIGADGLLFMSKGPSGLQVRFTAVGLGYALFDDQIVSETDLPQLAKSIAHLVTGYAPKLKLDPAKAIPISVLNLRADYATGDSIALERKLTLLLESRLTSVPEYVVLERRHAWSLGFERSLDTTAKPLLQGAYLVDGTLSLPAQATGNFTVQLRLRSPHGQQTDTAVLGSPDDLAALVEKMIVEIRKTTGSSTTLPQWQSQNEAREYLLEGMWGWQHNACEAALEAVDSAELLGAAPENVVPLRIQILCAIADQGMERWTPPYPDNLPVFDAAVLEDKTNAMVRAINETARYRDEKLEGKIQNFVPANSVERFKFRTGETIAKVSVVTSKILVLLERAQSPRADELRQKLRAVTGYDPLHGKTGSVQSSYMTNNGNAADVFADDWAQNLDEELAWFRLMFVDTQSRPPTFAFGDPSQLFCARFLPTPLERQNAFDAFVESLKNNPASMQTYLLLKMHEQDPATADAAYIDYLAYLWSRRDDLGSTDQDSPVFFNLWRLPQNVEDRNVKASLPLIHAILNNERPGRCGIVVVKSLLRPYALDPADAPLLWTEMNAYLKRRTDVAMQKNGRPDGFTSNEMNQLMEDFRSKFPDITIPLPPPSSDALVATRFWYPWLATNWPPGSCLVNILDVDDNGPWVSAYFNESHKDGIFRVNLGDLSTQIINVPDDHFPQNFKVARDALYMTWETTSQGNSDVRPHEIGRYDLATSTWSVHKLPDYSDCKLYTVENSLYFFLSLRFAGNEMAIARYDWDQDKMIMLSSTRRRPAQNQFDDRSGLQYAQIFSGPGHKPCVTTLEGTYYIQEKPGSWPEVFDGSFNNQTLTSLGRTLVLDQQGEVTLLDPGQATPEYWMAPSEPEFRKFRPGTPPVKEIASWSGQTIWNPPTNGHLWPGKVAFDGDHFFILDKPEVKGGDYDLICYQKGKGRNPRHIPLEFHLDDQARTALSNLPPGMPVTWKLSQTEHPDTTIYPSSEVQFVGTKQGLCIESENLGFWFLPYSDIDAYLAAHSP